MVVADLRFDAQRLRRRRARDEIHRARHEPRALQVDGVRAGRGVRLRFEVDDVRRPPQGETEPLLLTDRVPRDAAVSAEYPALAVHDGASAEDAGLTAPQEGAVVIVGDEADLLALGLVGRRQPRAPRAGPHLVLRQLGDANA